jgi:hypothetical protein
MGGGLLCAQKVLGIRNPISLLRGEEHQEEGGLLDGYII